ncbi:substrate-binding domain-containing protein, partial [Bacillus sp. SIMBA_074]
ITIALLQKQGDQQFFVDQAAGAKAAADKAGKVTLKVIDLKSDSNLAISQLDAMIAQKVDGILITVPDQQIGPQVISAAKAANIPLIALDDPIKDASGKEATFAGFDDHSMGAMAGDQTGPLYQA